MEPRPGEQVGPYRLERLLARGGMGAVWVAARADGARVALKLLLGTAPHQRARFEREAELAARLTHPGIVRVHAAGEAAGTRWIAMDLVDGESLLGRCGRVAPAEAARLVAQVARALAHAHAQGVLHRDVKPENVLVRQDGAALLTDFGVARDEGGASLTKTGALVGTPVYMAPEQATGQPSTAATDVHGLGLLLHALLTGAAVFQRETPAAVLVAVLEVRPDPPSALRAGVPRALDRLCQWALEKEPARRPTAAQLATSLEDVAAGRSPRDLPRASRAPLVALAGVAACALVALALRRGGPEAVVVTAPSPAPVATAASPVAVERPEPEPAWARPFLAGEGLAELRAAEEGLRGSPRLAPALRTRVTGALAARAACWRHPQPQLLAVSPAEEAEVRDAVERLVLLHLLARRLDPAHAVPAEHRQAITVLSVVVKASGEREARHLDACAELFPDDLDVLLYYATTGDQTGKDPRILAHGLALAEAAGDDQAWAELALTLAQTWEATAQLPGRAREANDALDALLPRALPRAAARPTEVSEVLEAAARAASRDGRHDVALERMARALAIDPARVSFVRERALLAIDAHRLTRESRYLDEALQGVDDLAALVRRTPSADAILLVLVPLAQHWLVTAGRRPDADRLADLELAASRPALAEAPLAAATYELWFDAGFAPARAAAALEELAVRLDARVATLEARGALEGSGRRLLVALRAGALDVARGVARGELDAPAARARLEALQGADVLERLPLPR